MILRILVIFKKCTFFFVKKVKNWNFGYFEQLTIFGNSHNNTKCSIFRAQSQLTFRIRINFEGFFKSQILITITTAVNTSRAETLFEILKLRFCSSQLERSSIQTLNNERYTVTHFIFRLTKLSYT